MPTCGDLMIGVRLRLQVRIADHLDHRRQFGLQRLGVGLPDRDRIDVEEIIGVGADRLLELRIVGVAGAMTDQRIEAQAKLAGLTQEQADVGVVAGVEDHVRPRPLQLGDQRRQIGRGGRIALVEHDVQAALLGAFLVALGDIDAIGAVLVDDGDAHVLRVLAELRLRSRRRPSRWRRGPIACRKAAAGTRISGDGRASTGEAMQVVIHMNFLNCSIRAAAGTHSAEE